MTIKALASSFFYEQRHLTYIILWWSRHKRIAVDFAWHFQSIQGWCKCTLNLFPYQTCFPFFCIPSIVYAHFFCCKSVSAGYMKMFFNTTWWNLYAYEGVSFPLCKANLNIVFVICPLCSFMQFPIEVSDRTNNKIILCRGSQWPAVHAAEKCMRRPSRDYSRYAAFLRTHCAYTLYSHMCYNR